MTARNILKYILSLSEMCGRKKLLLPSPRGPQTSVLPKDLSNPLAGVNILDTL